MACFTTRKHKICAKIFKCDLFRNAERPVCNSSLQQFLMGMQNVTHMYTEQIPQTCMISCCKVKRSEVLCYDATTCNFIVVMRNVSYCYPLKH